MLFSFRLEKLIEKWPNRALFQYIVSQNKAAATMPGLAKQRDRLIIENNLNVRVQIIPPAVEAGIRNPH